MSDMSKYSFFFLKNAATHVLHVLQPCANRIVLNGHYMIAIFFVVPI